MIYDESSRCFSNKIRNILNDTINRCNIKKYFDFYYNNRKAVIGLYYISQISENYFMTLRRQRPSVVEINNNKVPLTLSHENVTH